MGGYKRTWACKERQRLIGSRSVKSAEPLDRMPLVQCEMIIRDSLLHCCREVRTVFFHEKIINHEQLESHNISNVGGNTSEAND